MTTTNQPSDGGDAKDAARYRWLRDVCGLVEWKSMTGSANYCLPSGYLLDVTIDAAMEAAKS